jgi:hypothetical protein
MDYKPWQHQQKAQMESEVQKRQQAELTTNIASGATLSLVFGIIGLIPLGIGIIFGPIAIVLSLGAKSRIQENPGLGGRRRATAGLVLGIVAIVFAILGLLLRILA